MFATNQIALVRGRNVLKQVDLWLVVSYPSS